MNLDPKTLRFLAAGVEVVPTSAPLISDQMALLLAPFVAGAVASVLASIANSLLRAQKRKGRRASPFVLAMAAALNALALNFDQAGRQAKAAAGKRVDGGSGRGEYDVANDGKGGES